MHRVCLIATLAVAVAGCTSPRDERVQEYAGDGVWLFQKGQYAEAGECFQAAVALKPNDATLLYNLGESYQQRAAFPQAERYYNQCLQNEPDHAACRYALARLLVQMGRPSDAEHMIQDWLVRNQQSADALALDGWYRHQRGDLPGAHARLQQALDLESHNRRALIEMGLVYEAMQRPDRAVAIYERVVEDEPNEADVKQRVKGLLTKGARRPQPD
jgi:tetratricopeptide (TPR) repeat protein